MKTLIITGMAAMLSLAATAQEKAPKAAPAPQKKVAPAPQAAPRAQQAPPARQNRPVTPEERSERATQKVSEVAGLNEEQKKKVKQIMLDRERQREADRKKFQADKEAHKKAAMNNRRASDERLKQVLTPEQYQKVMSHRQEVKAKHKMKREQHGDKHKMKTKSEVKEEDSDDLDELDEL